MNTLIDNLITIFEAAITAGTCSATKVFKGLHDFPDIAAIGQYPYIMIDDGGERVDDVGSTAQRRVYIVIIEFACYSLKDLTESLEQVLSLSNEIKALLELEANRQKQGHTFGVRIDAFGWQEDMYFFRGRRVMIEFHELEERIFEY